MASVKDGYIFWCSKCKVDHSGECETDEVTVPVVKLWWNNVIFYYPGYIKLDDDGK